MSAIDKNIGWKTKLLGSSFIRNIKNPDETALLDLRNGDVEFGIPDKSLPLLLEKAELELYRATMVSVARFVYDPNNNWVVKKDRLGEELFNTYIPPFWKKDNLYFNLPFPVSPDAPPVIITEYLDHLTDGHTESKEYILDWLKTAMESRNFTILAAIGEPGVGKGKLGEIMSRLLGQHNFAKVRDNIFKNQFNGQLKNKQIIYVDEISITSKEEADRIKDMVNERIEIEKKGVDAEEIDNKASFYITSNRMDSIRIESGDRRFSVIQLTSKSLLDSTINGRWDELLSDETITTFGLYLKGRVIKNNMLKPFRSERYNVVLEAGLADWELFLLEEYFSELVGQEVTISGIKAAIGARFQYIKKMPGREKIKNLAGKFPAVVQMAQPKGKERVIKVIGKWNSSF
jgi:hypothetical protein